MHILHISDTHLGKRQYNLDFREEDIYNTFSQLIDIAIKEHVDAIIHTGDLFDVNDPPNKAEIVSIRELKRLKEAGIPFIVIAGDHDSPKRNTGVYPQKLLEELELIKFLTKPNMPVKINNVYIYGISHVPNVAREKLKEILSNLKPESRRSILLLHQGFKELLPWDMAWQLSFGDLPNDFFYYALGHFHTRYKTYLDGGRLVEVAGSPDIIREDEIDGYEQFGKGATLIDLSADIPEIQLIPVEIRRQIKVTLNTSKLTEDIKNLKTKLSANNSNKKPILHIILEGISIPRDELMRRLKELNEIAEYWRIYKDNTKSQKLKNDMEIPSETTIEKLIFNYLTKIYQFTEEEAKIVVDIIEKSEDEGYVIEQLKKMVGVQDDNKES